MDTTVVAADGSTSVTPATVPRSPEVDCFYIYPTVDQLPNPLLQTGNSPPMPTDAQTATLLVQAAPLLSRCRMFAPVYRQVPSVAAIVTPPTLEGGTVVGHQTGIGDIEQAWDDYWTHDNIDPATGQRRGVLILGHSQGAGIAAALIRARVDTDPDVRTHLIAAMILGGHVTPSSFRTISGCARTSASAPIPTGCVLAFHTFPAGQSSPLGIGEICTNPAALLAGRPEDTELPLDTQFQARGLVRNAADYPTGFVRYPTQVTGHCEQGKLVVTGAPEILGTSQPEIGLHGKEFGIAQGSLMMFAGQQIDAWLAHNA
ncbi:DUF3089 domain-containing protein [Nocardia sp. NPDC050435]|uniref:DUF3089 domain-containing protein n=1 Tax=Nocardia sp. NPDC050435 TaxID=3155040 RepID=UPI0033D74E04